MSQILQRRGSDSSSEERQTMQFLRNKRKAGKITKYQECFLHSTLEFSLVCWTQTLLCYSSQNNFVIDDHIREGISSAI